MTSQTPHPFTATLDERFGDVKADVLMAIIAHFSIPRPSVKRRFVPPQKPIHGVPRRRPNVNPFE